MMSKIILAVLCACLAQAALVKDAPNDGAIEVAKADPVGWFPENDDVANTGVEINEAGDNGGEQFDFDLERVSSEANSYAAGAFNSPFVCNNSRCHQWCRSRGWTRGRCINANTCRCTR